MKLTKKMFREVLNERHQEKVEREQKRLHSLPKDFVQREMDRTMGNGVYHARKRKQGDYLYAQDPDMFNHLFEEWKNDKCAKCRNSREFHPMMIADGLGHTERCEFVNVLEGEQ